MPTVRTESGQLFESSTVGYADADPRRRTGPNLAKTGLGYRIPDVTLPKSRPRVNLIGREPGTALTVPGRPGVNPLDVGGYKTVSDRAHSFDFLDQDHIPSFAALRQRFTIVYGRAPTPQEEREMYNIATVVVEPADVHANQPTTGGRNTNAQIQVDALDLESAAQRDFAKLREQLIQRGYDPAVVDQAIDQANERNHQRGVYSK